MLGGQSLTGGGVSNVARGLPPRAQRQVAPSDAPGPADEVALSEVELDKADDPSAGKLRVCTLNLGGRNTNSFEFIMAGASSKQLRYPRNAVSVSCCIRPLTRRRLQRARRRVAASVRHGVTRHH